MTAATACCMPVARPRQSWRPVGARSCLVFMALAASCHGTAGDVSTDARGDAPEAAGLDQSGSADTDQAIPPPDRVLHFEVGSLQTAATTGLSPPATFALPPGARATFVTLMGPPGVYLALSRWQSGGGPLLIVPGWVSGTHAPLLCTQGCAFRQSPRPEQQVSLAPNAPLPVQLAGTHEIVVQAFSWTGKDPAKPVAAKVAVAVDAVYGDPLPSGRLAVNLCLTGAGGLTAALAPKHERIAQAVATLRETFAAIAVDVTVTYMDVPGAHFVVHDASDLQVAELFRTAKGAPSGINVFLIQELSFEDGAKSLPMMGLSGGVPGPLGPAGGAQAGVVVALKLEVGQPDRLGVAIAHEIGHFLGLYHASDAAAADGTQLHDQLTDTPESDAANLMHWSPQPHSTKLSAQQAAVIKQSPWVAPP